MIDRSIPPRIHKIQVPELYQAEKCILNNGIPVHIIRLGTQNIIKLELTFRAGRWEENQALASRATAVLLKSGTKTRDADQIADQLEFYGAKLKIIDSFDHVKLRLYCLNKYLEKLLPILTDLLTEAVFPEDELKKFIKFNKQRLKLQLSKNDVVAYREFTEVLFGKTHPYGYNSSADHYDALNIEVLKEHFQRCFTASNCHIILAGKPLEDTIPLLNQYLIQLPLGGTSYAERNFEIPAHPLPKLHLPAPKTSVQASIRIGRRLFGRKHPDYAAFYFANTLLGGYFGARLMQNLREDKGYTYSIYSSLEALKRHSYFYICTDVATDVKDLAIREIYLELERLQEEKVSAEELDMVRNYSMGMLLNAIDGPFNVSGVLGELISHDMEANFFQNLIKVTQEINAEEIQTIARKYLQKEQLSEIVVG
ncbi:MAG: insulinase family protein [Saprospiraceae bacterium]|nr:insulinase family protein [Saprospiraceae bacterium]